MPRVKYLTKDTAPAKAQEILGKMPKVANIFGAMAHAPGVLEGILAASAGIRSGLDPKFRELAYLGASTFNDCQY